MARTLITVPPKPVSPVVIGEIDLDLLQRNSRNIRITSLRGLAWSAQAIALDGGSLIYVPSISPESL